MAFLSNDPPQLTAKRIEAVLNGKGLAFHTDADGDCVVPFGKGAILFMRVGKQKEVLAIVGRLEKTWPLSRRDEVRALLDEWHETRRWPKGYTTVVGGQVRVIAETHNDWEFGVTDKQLQLTMQEAMATSVSMFEFLESRL